MIIYSTIRCILQEQEAYGQKPNISCAISVKMRGTIWRQAVQRSARIISECQHIEINNKQASALHTLLYSVYLCCKVCAADFVLIFLDSRHPNCAMQTTQLQQSMQKVQRVEVFRLVFYCVIRLGFSASRNSP